MRITKKVARELIDVLEENHEKISTEAKELKKAGRRVYDYAQYERLRKEVKDDIDEFASLIKEAASMITIAKSAGRPKKFNLLERTHLFFLVRIIDKSNRDTAVLLGSLLEPFIGETVSYKYIERLYSDDQVKMVLHNAFKLMLKKKGVSGKFAGDGTGYSLLISKHYSTTPEKEAKDFRYVFNVLDLVTGLYVGVGYSPKSEMDAFHKAMKMVKDFGISIDQICLDKYYSSREVLKLFGKKTAVYLIPKKNIANIGLNWSRIFRKILKDPYEYLKTYFQRNLSEAAFSADKRRFGWIIRQKREDRQGMAIFSISMLHNIFSVRIVPK